MGEFGVDGDVAAEGAVDRRRRVELHVGAQVVAAGGALLAASARMLRLDGDTLADAGRVDVLPDRGDAARQLVAEDHGLLDDEVADPAVAVVVHVGSADADRRHLDENLVRLPASGPACPRSAACRPRSSHWPASCSDGIASLRSDVSRARPTTICWTPAATHSGATSSVTPPSTATGSSENRVVHAVTRPSRSSRQWSRVPGSMSITRTPSGSAGHRGSPLPSHSRHTAIQAEPPAAWMASYAFGGEGANGRNTTPGRNARIFGSTASTKSADPMTCTPIRVSVDGQRDHLQLGKTHAGGQALGHGHHVDVNVDARARPASGRRTAGIPERRTRSRPAAPGTPCATARARSSHASLRRAPARPPAAAHRVRSAARSLPCLRGSTRALASGNHRLARSTRPAVSARDATAAAWMHAPRAVASSTSGTVTSSPSRSASSCRVAGDRAPPPTAVAAPPSSTPHADQAVASRQQRQQGTLDEGAREFLARGLRGDVGERSAGVGPVGRAFPVEERHQHRTLGRSPPPSASRRCPSRSVPSRTAARSTTLAALSVLINGR